MDLSNTSAGESLRWKKFDVLNDGFCTLVDWMGDDFSVAQAARVSFGAGTRKVSSDRDLIRYLYRHSHTTPFEMCEIKLLVRVPMDCWRQWIRHRTASVNEYSTRYSEAIDSNQSTPPDSWRIQSASNKQGSGTNIGEFDDFPIGMENLRPEDCSGVGRYLSGREIEVHEFSREIYEERLKFGVAREQARKDLPLSTYTEAYWKCDLKNLFHFLSLRMDLHAQEEIRRYANVIGNEIVAKLFPICWEAFEDYDFRRSGLLLTRLEVEMVRTLSGSWTKDSFDKKCQEFGWPIEGKCRERDECIEKMRHLGIAD